MTLILDDKTHEEKVEDLLLKIEEQMKVMNFLMKWMLKIELSDEEILNGDRSDI